MQRPCQIPYDIFDRIQLKGRENYSMEIAIPPQAAAVLDRLNQSGYEAYLVGGCVRDSLLGRSPCDWDAATSARPEETERALSGFRVIGTGLKHGTVTVLSAGMPVEVTTYRVDGSYSDGRHPDRVSFTESLEDDLSRRDFTINALAYSPSSGVVDRFGGVEDLTKKYVRCVGEPDRRFEEDGLRILRALRFSAVLGFAVEPRTAESLVRNRALLDRIARERIQVEFTKLICGRDAAKVLRRFREVFAQFIPELTPCFGFEQHNPHHNYDVWEHTLHCIDAVEPEPVLRLTMLLHDIAKPECFSRDKAGVGHFYGHASKSAEQAKNILTRLRYDRRTVQAVEGLVRLHDLPMSPEPKVMRTRLNRLGEDQLRMLLKISAADVKAKAPEEFRRLRALEGCERELENILKQKECFSLDGLAVNGKDLLAIGITEGPAVGRTLRALLGAVIDGRCTNSHTALLQCAKNLREGKKP